MVDRSWNRSTTPGSQPAVPDSQPWPTDFIPCAATASMFLCAQGSVILCLHHDTLAVELRFTQHQEKVVFIAVDNVSERGAGRLVVSYDASQTAIVWDLFTGTEISRFASFEPLRVAAWMRNGNVVFGNGKGEVIYYEPSTSEHGSTRTIFDPITSLAPCQDCETYAIGYQNGSILIARLQPSFTVLHTLTTSKGPSPIICLTWHASSSKQKSDMLATQTGDGDLRVWSIAKPPGSDTPRIIRSLKRSETNLRGPKWIAWSKNGRIVQYAERETWLWDVRTRHVTYVTVPTIENVLGIANHGPTATLFTLGPNYTIQQYDLENPAVVANVQHLPYGLDDTDRSELRSTSPANFSQPGGFQDSRVPDIGFQDSVSQQRLDTTSPNSVRSRTDSNSSHASLGRPRPFSPPGKSNYSGTTFSMTSPAGGRHNSRPGTSLSYGSASSVRSRGKSKLRNEVTLSPNGEKPLEELFPFTRARVNSVPYNKHRFRLNESYMTPDNLRRQMLEIVFGWQGDIEDLIRDEMNRHPPGSQNAILLSRWLGEHKPEQLLTMLGSGTPSASAWMFLALSQMGGQEQANKMGQVFVQRLLENGDVHASATILLALGDRNDAIEVYVSRNYYMEAILMTCLLMPQDWQRQSHLVRQWGEYVVSNSQQQLALRCFMCAGIEPLGPWTSPTAPVAPPASFSDTHGLSSASEAQQRQTESPKPEPSHQRMTVKNSALKLITSFGPSTNPNFRFPGLKSDDGTPTKAPGVTPITESAVGEYPTSPGRWDWTRPSRSANTGSARSAGSAGYSRRRLPSIGETPIDVQPPSFPTQKSYSNPTDSERVQTTEQSNEEETNASASEIEAPLVLLTSARYEPGKEESSSSAGPQTAVQTTSNHFENINGSQYTQQNFFEKSKRSEQTGKDSKDRKPEGLQIQWPPPETSESDTGAYPSHSEQTDGVADTKSASSVFQSRKTNESSSVTGRSTDQYISSLDEASYYARHFRHTQHKSRHTEERTLAERGIRKQSSRNTSIESRGRTSHRYIQPAKRSPSSPVPMSPEDVARYCASTDSVATTSGTADRRSRSRGKSRARSTSSRGVDRKRKVSSRAASRTGRSRDRDGSAIRSPTSPKTNEALLRGFEDSLRLVTMDRERRSQHRSSSRRPERGTSARNEPSPDRRRQRARSSSRQARDARDANTSEQTPATESNEERLKGATTSDTSLSAAERTKREQAAAELEARRLSLARRPSAPNIPLPGSLQHGSASGNPGVRQDSSASEASFTQRILAKNNGNKRSPDPLSSSESSTGRGRSAVRVGLPTAPAVLRYPKYSDGHDDDDATHPTPADSTRHIDASKIRRSMSVPPPDYQPAIPADLPHHPMYIPNLPRSRSTSRTRLPHGHRRAGSQDLALGIHGSPPVVSVGVEPGSSTPQDRTAPPILPELQHLASPPPPPPAPQPDSKQEDAGGTVTGRSVSANELRRPGTAGQETQPVREFRRMSVDHRRGRSINETISTALRSFTGRMRSSSRGPRIQSPQNEFTDRLSPYESIQLPVDNAN